VDLFINEQTLGWFSLFLGVVLSLTFLLGLSNKSQSIYALIGAFVSLSGLFLSVTYQTSTISLEFGHIIQRRFQLIFPLIAALFFSYFATQFPRNIKEWKWANRLPFVMAGISIPFAIYLILEAFWVPGESEKKFILPLIAMIAFNIAIILALFGRKGFYFIKRNETAYANAVKVMIYPFSIALLAVSLELIVMYGYINSYTENALLCIIIQTFQFVLVGVFLNYSQTKASVVVRLLGFVFYIFLVIVGNSGHYIMGLVRSDYSQEISIQSGSNFLIKPTSHGHSIQRIPEPKFGGTKQCRDFSHMESTAIQLPKPFVYFGQPYSTLQVFREPFVVFAEKDFSFRFELALFYPSLLPFATFDNESLEYLEPFCYYTQEESLVLEWSNFRHKKTEMMNTVRLHLNFDGSMVWSYPSIYSKQIVSDSNWSTSIDFIGLTNGDTSPIQSSFDWSLPYEHHEVIGAGFGQNYQKVYLNYIHQRLRGMFWAMCVLYGLSVVFLPFYFRSYFVKPLLAIVGNIEKIADGNFHQKIPIRFNDEIGFISTAFNFMQSRLRKMQDLQEENLRLVQGQNQLLEEKVEERTLELNKRNQILENDLRLARKIQETILPKFREDLVLSTFYKPMDEVGGDFYDRVFFRDPDQIGLFVSDVSGHGVAAAFVTSMIKMSLLQAGDFKNNPDELMFYLNEVLFDHTAGHFVTAFYGIYHRKNRTFTYTNAGHVPPFLISIGGIKELESCESPGIGMFSNEELRNTGVSYSKIQIQVSHGEQIFLYTDGIIEVEKADNSMDFFTKERIQELLIQRHGFSQPETLNLVYEALKNHSGQEYFKDDICMLLFDSNKFVEEEIQS